MTKNKNAIKRMTPEDKIKAGEPWILNYMPADDVAPLLIEANKRNPVGYKHYIDDSLRKLLGTKRKKDLKTK